MQKYLVTIKCKLSGALPITYKIHKQNKRKQDERDLFVWVLIFEFDICV